ncbi:MAG TPA: hypothetical protein VM123_19130, partial [archaeon]|nr:hypothetical protein [archaeon]
MQEKDIQGILQKVEELKELFSIGERFVPFLEDLSLFVKEMASRLIEMNEAIQERSAEMPSADQQLDKVIGAPEGTAQEVLGKIEEMLSGLEEISSDFQVVSKRLAAEREAISEITSNIEELLKLPNARKSLSKVFEDKKARNKGMKIKEIVDNFLSERVDDEVPQKMEQLLQNTQNRAYDIMNALQDRDTAARQVKAAQGLLRTVEERLNELINKYSETEPPGIAGEEPAADTGAAFLESEEHRKLTDQVAEESRVEEETLVEKEEEEPEEKAEAVEAVASQEEIDSLFDSVESVGPAIEESFIPESKSFEYSPGQTQSPEEIDQILGEAVGVEAEEAAGESAAFTLGEELETAPVAEEEAGELPEAVEELEEAPEAAEEHEELPVAEEEAGELPEAVEE